MKFSIGDRILLKQTGEEGHVTAFINKQLIEVEVNGTTFPVHLDDIDHPYLKWFTDKGREKKKLPAPEQLPVENAADRKRRLAKGVYLSFLPVFKVVDMEEVADVMRIFLLNEMPVPVRFSYEVRLGGTVAFRHEGVLHAFGNVYLHNVSYPDMNDQPRFHWQVSDPESDIHGIAEGILRIKPAKLFEQVNAILAGGEPSFSYLLLTDFAPKKKPEPKEKWQPEIPSKQRPAVSASNIEPAKYELDLHIEQLVKNTRGLSNAEIIRIQLDALRHYVQLAIVHRQERMVVIHGLGKGKLREEVHAILKQIPEVGRFRNEWSGKYGFGATEIFFRY